MADLQQQQYSRSGSRPINHRSSSNNITVLSFPVSYPKKYDNNALRYMYVATVVSIQLALTKALFFFSSQSPSFFGLVLLRPHDRPIDQSTTKYVVVLTLAYILALKQPHITSIKTYVQETYAYLYVSVVFYGHLLIKFVILQCLN